LKSAIIANIVPQVVIGTPAEETVGGKITVTASLNNAQLLAYR